MLSKDFTEKFQALEGIYGNVHIKHILYGNQKYNRCVLHPFLGEERIGFIIDDEEKYVTMDELCGVSITDTGCYIKSEVMELYIEL